jgi:hypothetical protein
MGSTASKEIHYLGLQVTVRDTLAMNVLRTGDRSEGLRYHTAS